MSKDFKIWGIGYGLIGDLIMSLPLLTYFEKKYPNSYKIFVVEKKCSQCIEIFINHPMIDRIKITDGWDCVGDEDIKLASSCQIKDIAWTGIKGKRKPPYPNNCWHDDKYWYNKRNCIQETARRYGINDLEDVLSKEELHPKLYKWFDVGFDKSKKNSGYSNVKYDDSNSDVFKKNIAIWAFAGYGNDFGRSPNNSWWERLIDELIDRGFTVFHFGLDKEILSKSENYKKYTHLSFFEQIRISLASRLVIGCESGPMWIMGAYLHPAIHLITNYLPKHNENPLALCPVNKNAITFFDKKSCNNIKVEDVFCEIEKKIDI